MSSRGMTLVEMLVATAATMMLMGAIAQIFSVFGNAVSDSRSVIELDGRMRSVAWRLRNDLDGVTARTNPPVSPEADEGYFEVIEGPNNDRYVYVDPVGVGTPVKPLPFDKWDVTPGPFANSDDRLLGDTDDVLLFTTRNTQAEFIGKFRSARIESPVAEVAWFLRPTRVEGVVATANPTTYTLYRRQLLVVGYVGADPFFKGSGVNENMVSKTVYGTWASLFNALDVSLRLEGVNYVPNTLGDLTRRESRFMHNIPGVVTGGGFPYSFIGPGVAHQASVAPDGLVFDKLTGSARVSEDVVITNVIGFDIRVFDPAAPVSVTPPSGVAAVPGDTAFNSANVVANGCYVDLGNNVTAAKGPSGIAPRFASFGAPKSQLAGSVTAARVWDSWSTHYETNGIDEDGNYGSDQGANGLDDDGNGLVDEPPIDLNRDGVYKAAGELETSPPYPFPLRGIEVRIRCYEPSSRQVRQMTVRQTFVR
jgi:hypothetical protein